MITLPHSPKISNQISSKNYLIIRHPQSVQHRADAHFPSVRHHQTQPFLPGVQRSADTPSPSVRPPPNSHFYMPAAESTRLPGVPPYKKSHPDKKTHILSSRQLPQKIQCSIQFLIISRNLTQVFRQVHGKLQVLHHQECCLQ